MLYPIELWAQRTPPGDLIGRGREIRTPDILLPKQARYQTALYPEGTRETKVLGESRGRDHTRSSEKPSTRIKAAGVMEQPIIEAAWRVWPAGEQNWWLHDEHADNPPRIALCTWHRS